MKLEVRTVTALVPMPWESRVGILSGAYLRRLERWKAVRRPRTELQKRMDYDLEDALINGPGRGGS